MPSSVWRGHITFGLVTIPVRLYKAARKDRVKLREVYRVDTPSKPALEEPEVDFQENAPVQFARQEFVEQPAVIAPVRRVAAEDSGRVLPSPSISKGFEFEKGRFVTLDPSELEALVPKTSTELELLEFVDLASIDPIYFETSYYVQPEAAGEKPYALLYESLKQTGLAGVARIAMHRREHIVIIRSGASGLIAHTMYFGSEVRRNQEYKANEALVNPKELELANTLVRALAADFEPEKYRDSYREQLEELIEAKVAGQPAVPAPAPPAPKAAVDIMTALRKSLAELKKPAASEEAPPEATRATRRRAR
jgi:DNA end-binding protein Ku